mgnify:CR=1 FL=1
MKYKILFGFSMKKLVNPRFTGQFWHIYYLTLEAFVLLYLAPRTDAQPVIV